MPARFADFLPGSSTHLTHMPLSARQEQARLPPQAPNMPISSSPPISDHSSSQSSEDPQPEPFISEPSTFGLYCTYIHQPTFVPPDTLAGACDAPTLLGTSDTSRGVVPPQSAMGPGEGANATDDNDIFAPFTNPTCGLLMAWQYSGTNLKSATELDRLAKVQQDPLYDAKDLKGFTHAREMKLLDKYLQTQNNPFNEEHGWKCSSVSFHLPKEKTCFASEEDAPTITVDGIYHRDLTDVVKSAFEDPELSATFHMTPYTQHWKTADHRTVDVFSESFASPEMVDAHREVNALPRDEGDDLERVVAGLMVWSDSTHLTSFGDASMWPFYLFFTNQSKYTRCKPSERACHHVAYIPTVCTCIPGTIIN